MYNSSEMVDPKSVQLPVDKTRRKRLKVVSACSECRRKKTKCNGEKPCAGCIKTNMDCKYLNSPKSRPSNNRPLAASSATSASPPPTCLATSPSHQQAPRYYQATQQSQSQQQSNDKPNSTIQAIEARLGVIENILQILLKQQQQQQQQYHPYHHQQYHQKSAFVPVEQRNMQAHHSGPYHGEYQHDETNSGYHYGQSHKRKFDQVQQQSNVRLAPPHNYQPSLSESSSTSTTSSICSNSSPKMNTIQALLNNENEIKLDYSSSKPSAFYRPNPTIATTGSSNDVY
ncbi:unnamed protein product [Mucor circinelloides]|uniref:Zn(2)-C6 fungal-type domain-containing protein n=1 Tax=Mucor circinelloides f. circinelloides (strain 1006PhL) TaxID=1220926 RepID=S2K2I5_MUCC1|nr:hypothetical protein HMPREF1544_03797 [Mucor circinelloides 1006PhL]